MAARTEILLLNKRLGRVAQVLYRTVIVQHDTVIIRPLGATGVCTVNLFTPQNVVTVPSRMSNRDKPRVFLYKVPTGSTAETT